MIRAALLVLTMTSIAQAEPISSADARLQIAAPGQAQAVLGDVSFLSDAEQQILATLKDAMPFYGALALSPTEGLYADWVNASTQFHTRDSAKTAALAHCEGSKAAASVSCVVVLEVLPEMDNATFQLSAPAIAAFLGPFQGLQTPRAFAVSDTTGGFGFAQGSNEDALANCAKTGAALTDCRVVIRD